MSVLLQTLVLSFALAPNQTLTAQVGALYEGGDAARPQLNGTDCQDLSGAVDVRYTYALSSSTTLTTTPVAVLYIQDVSIPAASTTTTDTTGTTTTTTSSVACSEPADDKILLDNITLTATSGELLLSSLRYLSLEELMSDLCDEEEGIRKRRAVCLGIRPGSGTTTVARGGDGPDIDTEPPGAPRSLSAQEGDAMALVQAEAPSDADSVERGEMTYVVQYRPCTPEEAALDAPDAGDAGTADAGDGGTGDANTESTGPCGEWAATDAQGSPVVVSNLGNNVVYQLRAYAVDGFGNSGPVGDDTVFVTPRQEYAFLDLYGQPVYGVSCAHASSAAAEPLTVLTLYLAVRGIRGRRRK
ncbi:MAG: hypothetical protein AB2A00_39815 [Myxococcota bacterium]